MRPSTDVTFDSQVLTYLVKANQAGYDPAADPEGSRVAEEKVAAFRIFVYHLELLQILPTVAAEVERIANPHWRREHEEMIRVHFFEMPDQYLPQEKIDSLAAYYQRFHSDVDDCRVVAEAELFRVGFLLTFDHDLFNRLNGRTGYLVLGTASWFWRFLKIPVGAAPKNALHPSHPLYEASWWKW